MHHYRVINIRSCIALEIKLKELKNHSLSQLKENTTKTFKAATWTGRIQCAIPKGCHSEQSFFKMPAGISTTKPNLT